MPTPDDLLIKARLKALLEPEIPLAQVLTYQAVAFVEGEDPTVLRSEAEAQDSQGQYRIHTLMITFRGLGQTPPFPHDATRGPQVVKAGKNVVTYEYDLYYIYGFAPFADDLDDDDQIIPTENTVSVNVKAMREKLNDNPKLGFGYTPQTPATNYAPFVNEHGKLQIPLAVPVAFGDALAHVVNMRLSVPVIEALG